MQMTIVNINNLALNFLLQSSILDHVIIWYAEEHNLFQTAKGKKLDERDKNVNTSLNIWYAEETRINKTAIGDRQMDPEKKLSIKVNYI